MLEIGSVISGTYKILNKIGEGGTSTVYLAVNERANRPWAVKEVLKDSVHNFEAVRQGLLVETEMLKKLKHPHLPGIADVFEDEKRLLIVMDYIEGISLEKTLLESGGGGMDAEQVVSWGKQLCDVLGYLHSRKRPIIYRDMKPSNVMLKPDGNIVLIDFGTAREFKERKAEDTAVLGTAGYAAPEQYGGKGQTDARTDIYSLGATLYHLVTGQNPCTYQYGIFPFQEYPIRHWNPNLSSGLEAVLLKCTMPRPEDRYQSCAELMYALEHYHELDEEYRKKQDRKWRRFTASAAACFSLTAASLGCFGAAYRATANSYEACIAAAESDSVSPTYAEKVEKLQNAAALDPTRPEAYFDLLGGFDEEGSFGGVILSDGIMTAKEDELIREMLNGIGASAERTNREYFQTNAEWYGQFCNSLGIAYYYYFEEDSASKSRSREWLQGAADSESLDETARNRAEKLARIAGYYQRIGVEDISGDMEVSYSDYWKDLTEIASGNLTVQTGNKMTALAVYRELAVRVYDLAGNFKAAGITEEEIYEQLDNMETRLESDIIIEDEEKQQTAARLKESVKELAQQARIQTEITYGREA